MTFKSICAFSAFSVPNLDKGIWGGGHQPLTSLVVHQGPDTFFVTLHGGSAFVARCVPNFDGLVVGGGGELLFICWICAKGIDGVVVL